MRDLVDGSRHLHGRQLRRARQRRRRHRRAWCIGGRRRRGARCRGPRRLCSRRVCATRRVRVQRRDDRACLQPEGITGRVCVRATRHESWTELTRCMSSPSLAPSRPPSHRHRKRTLWECGSRDIHCRRHIWEARIAPPPVRQAVPEQRETDAGGRARPTRQGRASTVRVLSGPVAASVISPCLPGARSA